MSKTSTRNSNQQRNQTTMPTNYRVVKTKLSSSTNYDPQAAGEIVPLVRKAKNKWYYATEGDCLEIYGPFPSRASAIADWISRFDPTGCTIEESEDGIHDDLLRYAIGPADGELIAEFQDHGTANFVAWSLNLISPGKVTFKYRKWKSNPHAVFAKLKGKHSRNEIDEIVHNLEKAADIAADLYHLFLRSFCRQSTSL